MIFGAIGDVRGNLPALRAVLHSLEEEGIQSIVNTGDSAVGFGEPNGVIDALILAKVVSVQGERDRHLTRFLRKRNSLQERLSKEDFDALEKASELCGSRQAEYLRSLPPSLTITIDGISVALCHGSLTSQAEVLASDGSEALFLRQRELTHAPIIVCGRGGEAFLRTERGTMFLNPGSVGMAADGRAHYAVFSTEREPWDAELREVEYVST